MEANTEALLDIKQDVGEIKGLIRGMSEKLDSHIEDDAAVEKRVRRLEFTDAKSRGRISVWHALGAGMAVLLGIFGDWLWDHFSH